MLGMELVLNYGILCLELGSIRQKKWNDVCKQIV